MTLTGDCPETGSAPGHRPAGPLRLERVACPLCGARGEAGARQVGAWRIARCSGCGLAYLNPRPAVAELPRLYGADYFTRDISDAAEDLWRLTPAEETARVAVQSRRLDLIERFALRRGRLLDVGCGPGYVLAQARARGWQVRGRELSEWACRYARERLGLDVRPGTIADETRDDGLYDVIALYHTLEHLPDPLPALERARALLRPGGRLVIEVPNYGGLDARMFGDRWEGLRLPYHLTHFEPATLRRLAERAGFRVLALETDLPRPLLEGWVALKASLGRPPTADRCPRTTDHRPQTTNHARLLESAGGTGGSISEAAAVGSRRSAVFRRRLRRLAARWLPGRDMTLVATT